MKKLINLVLLVGMLTYSGSVGITQANGFVTGVSVLQEAESSLWGPALVGAGMPGWSVRDKPVPQHEPGQISRDASYEPRMSLQNINGTVEAVQLTGLEAMVADGLDPLAGNYRLVGKDSIAVGIYNWTNHSINLSTYQNNSIDSVPDSGIPLAPTGSTVRQSLDITAGDLNGDGVDEQIAAWLDKDTHTIQLAIGEMPGTDGRPSSDPAASADGDSVDLLVRGYDQALWYAHFDGSDWSAWNNTAGGLLLSAPAIISRGAGAFDAFAIGSDNQVYQRHWDGGEWGEPWTGLPPDPIFSTVPAWLGSPPDLPAPEVVAGEAGILEVFRIAPDHTLRWNHFDGATWQGWQGLGGMFASGPGALVLDDERVQVFAIGVDQALWYLLSEGAGWEMDGSAFNWQRVELDGMDEGVTPVSAPSAVQMGPGEVQVFMHASDDNLWQVTNDGVWGSWSKGGNLISRPAAALRSSAGLILFALAADGSLQQSSDGITWSALPESWLPACCLASPIDTGIESYGTNELTNPVNQLNLVDVETGHFLGDGREQIALAYKWVEADIKNNGIAVQLFDVTDGFRSLIEMGDGIGTDGIGPERTYWQDYYPRIAVGEFDGDAPEELALAYATRKGGVRVYQDINYTGRQLAWLKAGTYSMPYGYNDVISSIYVYPGWEVCVYNTDPPGGQEKCFTEGDPYLHDDYYVGGGEVWDTISTVKVTQVGDFPDGQEMYTVTNGVYPQLNAHIALEIFDIDPQDPTPTSQAADFYQIVIEDPIYNPLPERTLGITAGDFDGTRNFQGKLDDEIALIYDKVNIGYGDDNYWSMFQILDVDLSDMVTPIESHGDYVPEAKYVDFSDEINWPSSAGIAMASGDFDGDGRAEIARTWPTGFDGSDWPDLYRDLQVLDWNGSSWNTSTHGLEGYSRDSYQDALVAGDLNLDLKDEIVFLEHVYDTIRSYTFTPKGVITPITGGNEVILMGWNIPVLATGDFSGEGIRVGQPAYRRQYDVGQIIAIVNAPPKHEDTIDGVTINLNADDEYTYSQFEQTVGNSTEVSVTTQKDWAVDSEFKATIGNPEATHVSTSLSNSYGENFEYTGGSTQSLTYTQSIKAITDDVIYYTRMDYDVWEYPVYDSITNIPQGNLSVVWPVSGMHSAVESANTCDGWYKPNHQLMNVWSYPVDVGQLLDHGGGTDLYDDHPTYMIGTNDVDFSVEFSSLEETRRSHEYSLGFASSFEAQIGGEEVGVNLGVVSFSARMPSLYFSTSVSYNASELSTWKTQTSNDTKLSGYFAPIPDGNNRLYNVTPYLYWSEDNYLVVDYVTSPSNQAFWSTSGANYDRPDPAFILPWTEGTCNHLWLDAEYFTSDITIDPPIAKPGETVTITATLRNFSNKGNGIPPYNQPFNVTFYRGDPDSGGIQIGEATIAVGELGPRAVISRSFDWVAEGSGEQHIYAVIDSGDTLVEVHDEHDAFVNNNKGYGVLSMDEIEFIDMGQAVEKSYQPVTLVSGDPGPISSLYVPLGVLTGNLRIDMITMIVSEGLDFLGLPFEVGAFQTDWETAEPDLSFAPEEGGDPPAVMMIDYAGVDLTGFNEELLMLYRFTGIEWEVANRSCGVGDGDVPLYEPQRFQEQDLLTVPICQTGIFVITDSQPVVLLPEAAFSADLFTGVVPLSVQFKDLSLNATSWKWDFGDGSALSYEQNPVHEYNSPGVYTVRLRVSNAVASDMVTKEAYIKVFAIQIYMPLVLK